MAGVESGGIRCVCIIACNFWPPCCECHLMSATLPQPSRLAVHECGGGASGKGSVEGGGRVAVEQRFTIFIGIPCILVSLMWVSFRVSVCLSFPCLSLPCPTRDLHANSGETKQENANEKIEGNSFAISVNKYPVHTDTWHTHSPGHPPPLYAFLAEFAPTQTPTAKRPSRPPPSRSTPLTMPAVTAPSTDNATALPPRSACPVVQRSYCRR